MTVPFAIENFATAACDVTPRTTPTDADIAEYGNYFVWPVLPKSL
jgi:hypothetical protein